MFCGGTKKTQKTVIEDPNNCKTHKKPFDSICIDGTGPSRLCKGCREQNEIKYVMYNDVQALIQKNDFDLMIIELGKVERKWDCDWKAKQEAQVKKITDMITQMHEKIIFDYVVGEGNKTSFLSHEWSQILDSNIIQELENVGTQHTTIQKLENEQALYILGKLCMNPTEIPIIISSVNKDFKILEDKIKALQSDIDQKIEIFSKSLNQITQKVCSSSNLMNLKAETIKQVSKDEVFNFIHNHEKESLQYIQKINAQIEKITGTQLKEIKLNADDQFTENVQIRSFTQLSSTVMAFCSNLKQIHLLKIPELSVIDILQEDADVITIGKCKINGEIFLVSATEDMNSYSLGVWNLDTLTKVSAFQAHNGHIWNIIQLPGNNIATCSDDASVKVWDMETRQCKLEILIHQGGVNDIALVSNKFLVSVSEDQTLALTDFVTGCQEGVAVEENEIKCVVALDGQLFCTGDSNGFICIYSIEKLEVIRKIKLHKALIRNIVRINSKTIATASWDGLHQFYSVEQDNVLKKIEGPRKNFSEGIIWLQDYDIMVAGSGGKVKIYK